MRKLLPIALALVLFATACQGPPGPTGPPGPQGQRGPQGLQGPTALSPEEAQTLKGNVDSLAKRVETLASFTTTTANGLERLRNDIREDINKMKDTLMMPQIVVAGYELATQYGDTACISARDVTLIEVEVKPGQDVLICGSNFKPGELVSLEEQIFDSGIRGGTLKTITANLAGKFSTRITIPASSAWKPKAPWANQYGLTARGDKGSEADSNRLDVTIPQR